MEDAITNSQLTSLDDTDCYSTAWEEALRKAAAASAVASDAASGGKLKWGGRGQGGRGTARRTFQPKDVVVDGVRLEFVGSGSGIEEAGSRSSRLLLEDATLKLLSPGRVYGLIGRNGCGKSSLLKRMAAGKIPGFPPHVSTLHIPQQADVTTADGDTATTAITPVQYVVRQRAIHSQTSKRSVQQEIEQLEEQLDRLDVESEEDRALIEDLGGQISQLEDDEYEADDNEAEAEEALSFMGLPRALANVPMARLSPGLRKKVALAVALVCPCDLLLLDEPANSLDVPGLLRLRQLVSLLCTGSKSRGTTILLVSHDLDLVNDMATDMLELAQLKLHSYPGNYSDYLVYRQQHDLHSLRQVVTLEKKRANMVKTLENLKKQPTPRRGGGDRKKAKQIECQRKKIEREGLNVDEKGHKWKQQKAGTGMKPGSVNAVVDASTRRGLTTQQLLKLTEKSVRPPPDKAVQFCFRNPTCQWGEPLIMALDVGHGYEDALVSVDPHPDVPKELLPKPGLLFDCVDLCVDEGKRYCFFGKNGCGTSVLLRILAKREEPLEGTVKHALNVDVGYLDQQVVDDMMMNGSASSSTSGQSKSTADNCISFLSSRFPQKTEQDIRAELSAFGLSPGQATTSVRYLSGGESRRLCLAALMLGDPQVLVLDNPTSDLDVESVEALIDGLSRWTGTVVVVSHDAHFVRSLEANCFALVDGRLRRIGEGGIDTYLRSFAY